MRPNEPWGTLDDPVANDATALTPEQQRVRELHLNPPAPSYGNNWRVGAMVVGIAVVAWYLWQFATCVIRGAC